ncbi:putative regulatory protein, FmdB family [Tepidimonas alkaliphilus]|uniref:Putative regulatory protein, FmdB family n=1 Tax=Tepidimonas alkaliphilus TaxID=2588942 RepID=A0A554WB35_9BURK|nr:FmdB family zinc ribbon protein [Tepidimonas alkaliphilus]TSE20793.1 putative regulatory protein, FmdB family [Tepidimonas alkaliphilus]
MPIYAYKCESCGYAKDVLQKVSDEPLTVCPACGAPTFRKQLTAAGFQLKGTGWYVTDFRNSGGGAAKAAGAGAAAGASAEASSSSSSSSSGGEAASTPCGAACACH